MKTDSHMVVSEVRGDTQVKDALLQKYLATVKKRVDNHRSTLIKKRACRHTIIEVRLFKRGFSTPLLKCLDSGETTYALEEMHEGIDGQHLGVRALDRKLLRAGYY